MARSLDSSDFSISCFRERGNDRYTSIMNAANVSFSYLYPPSSHALTVATQQRTSLRYLTLSVLVVKTGRARCSDEFQSAGPITVGNLHIFSASGWRLQEHCIETDYNFKCPQNGLGSFASRYTLVHASSVLYWFNFYRLLSTLLLS